MICHGEIEHYLSTFEAANLVTELIQLNILFNYVGKIL